MTQKVRGDLWSHNGTGQHRAVKRVDEHVFNDQVVHNDAELFVRLQANAHYRISGAIFCNLTGDGIRLALGGEVNAEAMKVHVKIYDNALSSVGRLAAIDEEITAGPAGTGDHFISLDGSIKTGNQGGRMHVRWAQQNAGAVTLMFQKNSFLEATRIL